MNKAAVKARQYQRLVRIRNKFTPIRSDEDLEKVKKINKIMKKLDLFGHGYEKCPIQFNFSNSHQKRGA